MSDDAYTEKAAAEGYQVLARKHRPQSFDALIGQEAMVRTLRNAFENDRIAHAFILTGVRGVGKTTTARIIAKGLNCIGPDGAGGPTIHPCGACEPCRAIAKSRHVDVIEMDAASQTGVGDIREIIDSVRYRAASARYKIYIIDEVHMLSKSAFNALLKTLEEPPPHVKFIFATTEINKVPATVLSRCQRFDLRRIDSDMLIDFLRGICAAESASAADDALALIARAAEGSVRDALSLLDQAIAHGAADAGQVRAMLGLADRGRVFDLFELIMRGDAAGALGELNQQYADGADPVAVLRDLAEATHWVSVVKIAPQSAEDPTMPEGERLRGKAAAESLSMRTLSRAWQMLLKALDETARAPAPMMAAEMAVIRLTHVADLPSPEDILRKLGAETLRTSNPAPATPPPGRQGGGIGSGSSAVRAAPSPRLAAENAPNATPGTTSALPPARASALAPAPGIQADARANGRAETRAEALARYQSFEDVAALIREKRDGKLLFEVETCLRLAAYQPGRIEFTPTAAAPATLASDLSGRLSAWTGQRWMVSVAPGADAPTLDETRREREAAMRASVEDHPLVAAARAAFPGAKIRAVRKFGQEAEQAQTSPPPEAGDFIDDWSGDPFAEEE